VDAEKEEQARKEEAAKYKMLCSRPFDSGFRQPRQQLTDVERVLQQTFKGKKEPGVNYELKRRPAGVQFRVQAGRPIRTPFFQSMPSSPDMGQLLPVMQTWYEADKSATASTVWAEGQTAQDNIGAVLDLLGSILEGPALFGVQPTREAFIRPLLLAKQGEGGQEDSISLPSVHPACMFVDMAKAKATKHIHCNSNKAGHVKVLLGYKKGGGGVIEWAHRLVLHAIYGPPPEGRLHALHVCGNTRCLNPMHLVWGSNRCNYLDDEGHYNTLLVEQGRPCHAWT
jgi:hypothetical protein